MRREGGKGGGWIMMSCRYSFSSSYPMFTAQVPSLPGLAGNRLNPRGQANTNKKRPKSIHWHRALVLIRPHLNFDRPETRGSGPSTPRPSPSSEWTLLRSGAVGSAARLRGSEERDARVSLTCERAALNICAFISPLISMGMRLPSRTREKEVCPEDDVTAA